MATTDKSNDRKHKRILVDEEMKENVEQVKKVQRKKRLTKPKSPIRIIKKQSVSKLYLRESSVIENSVGEKSELKAMKLVSDEQLKPCYDAYSSSESELDCYETLPNALLSFDPRTVDCWEINIPTPIQALPNWYNRYSSRLQFRSPRHHQGYLEIPSFGLVWIELILPRAFIMNKSSSLQGTRILGNWKWWQFAVGREALIQKKLGQCASLEQAVDMLIDLMSEWQKSRTKFLLSPTATFSLLKEIGTFIGLENVKDWQLEQGTLTWHWKDAQNRIHIIPVKVLSAGLSSQFILKVPPKEKVLVSTFAEAKQAISKQLAPFDLFWQEMDIIDAHCHILEPEQPTRADTLRRIVLGEGVALSFTVDPLKPREKPISWSLYGPHKRIAPFQQRLNDLKQWQQNWSLHDSLLHNWQRLLACSFPSQRENTEQQPLESHTCAICYQVRLEGQLAEESCPNVKCNRLFHRYCLQESIAASRRGRQTFNVLFGVCPYCSETISVTLL